MLSDLDCLKLCQAQYNDESGVFENNFLYDGDRVSVKYYPDCTVIVDEGSHDLLNWIFNFQAAMSWMTGHAGVEGGFLINIGQSFMQMRALISKNKTVYCVGHSRGAARAFIRAAFMLQDGFKVRVVTFGSPRPGDARLAEILSTAEYIHSYRNGHDPVCRVPIYIPKIAEYVEPVPFIMLDVPPVDGDDWGHEMGYHHIENYAKGVEAYGQSSSSR